MQWGYKVLTSLVTAFHPHCIHREIKTKIIRVKKEEP